MTTRAAQQPQEVPPGILATLPEYHALWALERLGLRIGVDFSFQSSLLGGRQERGGLIVDFIFPDRALAISVLGIYFHYVLGGGSEGRDLLTREVLVAQGLTLIFVDEDALAQDAVAVMRAALNGQDLSRRAVGGGVFT